MVLQTELNPQVERRDKRRNAHRPWHLAQPLWIKYFVLVPCYAEQLKGFRAST